MTSWSAPLLEATPGDDIIGGSIRSVPGVVWSKCDASRMPNPEMHLWTATLATELGGLEPDPLVWTGQRTLPGMVPHAHRYGGHQFGHWAHQLGDGRALSLGHLQTEDGLIEVQLKGAGRTPYSRRGDGRAVLRSSLREFLCSEAMHHLGVPTSRALALCGTGESVRRDMFYDGRPALEPGAILVRTAPSFLRFGSFQMLAADGAYDAIRALLDHVVSTHEEGHTVSDDEGRVCWLISVAERSAHMVCGWMRHGFVHGVMNTDNMSIHGLTIDYGPFGWVEAHDPTWTPNTTDLPGRRYRFGSQPDVVAWNLARLLEALVPVMDAPERLNEVLMAYRATYDEARQKAWVERLGLRSWDDGDESLVADLQRCMHRMELDHIPTLRALADGATRAEAIIEAGWCYSDDPDASDLQAWIDRWLDRTSNDPDRAGMMATIPAFRLRNWVLQSAIDDAERGDWSKASELADRIRDPYNHRTSDEDAWWSSPRPDWALTRPGCSMLSCSS